MYKRQQAIYWRDYMVAPGFDKLPLPLMLVAFDSGVNCGPVTAARWVAEAERETGIRAQIEKVCALSLAYHKGLKTWPRYGKGWAARIAAGQKQALLLAAVAPVAVAPKTALPEAHTVTATPQAKSQPQASGWTLFWRAVLSGLFAPIPQGA